jgi:DNA ligase-1
VSAASSRDIQCPLHQGLLSAAASGITDAGAALATLLQPLSPHDEPALKAHLETSCVTAKRCWATLPDFGQLLPALLRGGIQGMVAAARSRCGIPFSPMLAKVATSAQEALERMAVLPARGEKETDDEGDDAADELLAATLGLGAGERRVVALDYKYDGQRAQIHIQRAREDRAATPAAASGDCPGVVIRSEFNRSRDCHDVHVEYGGVSGTAVTWRVRVFSRHLEHTTARWPDVCEAAAQAVDPWVQSAVLDAEVIAVQLQAPGESVPSCRPIGGEASAASAAPGGGHAVILPFQALAARSKTANEGSAAAASAQVRCAVVAFDCYSLEAQRTSDGGDWRLDASACDVVLRRAALAAAFRPIPGVFERSRWMATDAVEEVAAFLKDALACGCEGLMVKCVGDAWRHKALEMRHNPVQAFKEWRETQSGSPTAAVHLATGAPDQADAESDSGDSTAKPGTEAAAAAASSSSSADHGAGTLSRPSRELARGAPRSMLQPIPIAAYAAGGRSDLWLKLKRDYVEALADTLDLVPIGAWYGNGRKAGWFSPVLVAAYDPDTEEFCSLCRVMSGITDEQYKELTAFYSKPDNYLLPPGQAVPESVSSSEASASGSAAQPPAREARDWLPPGFSTGERPSVWFRPCRVWEVRGADLTLSPVHTAGAGLRHDVRGFGLRFPRFIRERDDKGPANSTTPEQLVSWFDRQGHQPSS